MTRDLRPPVRGRVGRHLDEEPLDLDHADDGVDFSWGCEIPVRHGGTPPAREDRLP